MLIHERMAQLPPGVTELFASGRSPVLIVCHCHVVSDRAIRAEVEGGAATPDDVAERCGAGARCGSCRPTIVALLATSVLREHAQPAA